MRQMDVFNKIQEQLKADTTVSGILLMGSVAQGNAMPESDLDIMVLGSKDDFITEVVDDILVEYIFTTYEKRFDQLSNNEMEPYHFLNSKIVYDVGGKLRELSEIAKNKYNSFKTRMVVKKQLSHWLFSTKIKLLSAINASNTLQQNFIVSTNAWKVIEAIWAVNDKPIPPSGSVIKRKSDLTILPSPDWFERLFSCESTAKTNTMIGIIEWVLPKLDEHTK